ncbi:cytosine deaminase [Singulisphaera sp. GP187]|uniref:amidohydrolase family protein n=1 Tax=Singulisphaera sp. GP187 TaxID=1882752 RepID=UPI00092AE3F9|nr:amidohydrolase family protein [Singulisphaera sp. GP187]SIO06533.1 cytosine deaminase [Singulisphaera sp. GP187]
MQNADTIFRGAKLVDGTPSALVVKNGKFVAIGRDADVGTSARNVVDLGGALVVPGFVEGHIHLDISLYGDTWKSHKPCTAGFDVRERVEIQRQDMAAAAPMDERARNQLDLCISNGTTQMRSHVMVDASVGLKSLETILAVREEYRDRIDIQLVAFPQSGIITCPGTAQLLDAAFDLGCDLIGGLDPASFDRDTKAHLDVVFGIAEKRGVGVDIHLHEPNQLGIFVLEEIAARTRALGLQGKVAVSHAYALGEVPIDVLRRTAHTLAAAGVAIMTNAPGSHPFPPVMELRQAGVTVFSGSDNIRDSWWPYGDGDMLGRAMMIGYRSGFYTDEELGVAFELVTEEGAKALGLSDYGLRVGASADFVTLTAEHIPEAVVSVPKPRSVYKAGQCVVSNGVQIRK